MRTSRTGRAAATLAVGSAAALLVGPVAVAGPATAAQEPEPPTLAAELTPTVVAPGGELRYSSIDPCPETEGVRLVYSYGPDGWASTEGSVDFESGETDVREDGGWTATVTAPAEPGPYEIIALCKIGEVDPDAGPAGGGPVRIGQYPALDFEVVAATESTTPPTPPVGSARPVPAEPDYTG